MLALEKESQSDNEKEINETIKENGKKKPNTLKESRMLLNKEKRKIVEEKLRH